MNQVTELAPEGETVGETGPTKMSTQEVYTVLRRKILEHEIPPATRINIHHISSELGVSPTPVREALRLLQGDNLLVATSNKGYTTTQLLNTDQTRSLFEFRLLIEPWAARMAAVNSLRNPAHTLQEELQQFKHTRDSARHVGFAHDDRFHRTIIQSTGNPNVIHAYEQSHCHLHLFRLYHLNTDWAVAVGEHREIHRAIAEANPNQAEEAMRAHLHNSYNRFVTRLSEATEGFNPLADIPLGSIAP